MAVTLTFRELALLAPDAGLYCEYCSAHSSFLLDPQVDDETDQLKRVEDYAEWKEAVERCPQEVNRPPSRDAAKVAATEEWFIEALRKTNRT